MATEQVIERVAENVAENLEGAADVTRKLNTQGIGWGFVGLGVGVVVGFYFGRRWNREKIRAEVFKQSEKEIEAIRRFYQEKSEAVKIVQTKPDLDEVVEEKGYVEPVPPAPSIVQPPRPTQPPVPVQEPPVLPRRDFTPGGVAKRHVEREKDKNEHWDYGLELQHRTNTHPYIIHQDEHAHNEEGYTQETLTYYAVDAVLTDEDEQPIDLPDATVGLENLSKFGHGSDDYHVVYIRNDALETDYEVCLLAASYAETVQGQSNDSTAD